MKFILTLIFLIFIVLFALRIDRFPTRMSFQKCSKLTHQWRFVASQSTTGCYFDNANTSIVAGTTILVNFTILKLLLLLQIIYSNNDTVKWVIIRRGGEKKRKIRKNSFRTFTPTFLRFCSSTCFLFCSILCCFTISVRLLMYSSVCDKRKAKRLSFFWSINFLYPSSSSAIRRRIRSFSMRSCSFFCSRSALAW